MKRDSKTRESRKHSVIRTVSSCPSVTGTPKNEAAGWNVLRKCRIVLTIFAKPTRFPKWISVAQHGTGGVFVGFAMRERSVCGFRQTAGNRRY
jgi:hypothetical protein